jgi:ketosteroid isomerase-like protein
LLVTDREDVIRLTEDAGRAWATSDAGRLSELIADDYSHVDIYGQQYDRATWLRSVEERRTTGQLSVHEEDVQVVGDTAVVTSCVSLSQIHGGTRARLIHVWVRTPHGWRRRWYQATLVQNAD